ncbi:LysR family transcriptional regulator [Vibrio nitrifigilis]|uniref:LysR family transcriptional regulator n=1 Tax=Vibrio nitrifigilis TaxID=2789781 RepID=A0ABS0GFJ3_9VIBR|nr:LysR family transcriptional regulator [Vibrio nitrifigilis]MBF9001013.1 LysR family transcriptional regulator [Vibrio nitrifigilis]
MELRYLKYFVTVAQTHHFTRAAEQLGIAQPPLSQQIKKLEQEIGAPLFDRSSRKVELTKVGETFYVDALNILNNVEQAKAKAKQMARGENTEVRIGFATSTAICNQVLSVMRQLREYFPEVNFVGVELPMHKLVEQLKEKQLDIAFKRLPCYACEQLEKRVLFEEPFIAVIPSTNPLAQRKHISLDELSTERLLLFPRETGPALYDEMTSLFTHRGIAINSQYAAPQLRSAVAMSQAGFGIAIVPRSLAEHLDDSARCTEIDDMPLVSQVVMAWEPSNFNHQVRKIIQRISKYQDGHI